jgi:phospholipase C
VRPHSASRAGTVLALEVWCIASGISGRRAEPSEPPISSAYRRCLRLETSLIRYGLSMGAAVSLLVGCGGGQPPLSASNISTSGSALPSANSKKRGSPIKHVILVVQENRSFDNFFALFPGVDGASRGKMKVKVGGKYVDRWQKLEPHSLLMKRSDGKFTDIQHCHQAYLTAYDNGKMDGFNLVDLGVCPNGTMQAGKLVYQYVEQSQIEPYWDIAEQWVLADHMFQTQGSGSFTAHQDLIRGGTAIDSQNSIIDNPTIMPWGCDSGPNSVTSLITTSGQYLRDKGPFPCTNHFPSSGSAYTTLRDLLDAKGVSWKYYSPCFKAWNPNGCDDGCPSTCSGALLNAFDVIWPVRNSSEWGTNVSMPETNIFTDISSGSLPAVSWVIPADDNDDHPGEPIDNGPAWVASIVNAIGESSYWNSSAIVIVWDDWGGLYDNAAPPFQNGQGGLGFRVPMLVVSPYAIEGNSSQGGYISHTQYEFGSILKYIELNWRLGSLGTTDKSAKHSIGDVFNYTQSPRAFRAIPSERSMRFFEQQPRTAQHGDPQ